MDDRFRLVFANPEQTPTAADFLSDGAIVCDRLPEAVRLGATLNIVWGVPFIAHRFFVLEPATITLLHRELLADA